MLAALVMASAAVPAAPHIPESDREVLERLPFRPNSPFLREAASLKQQLAADPQNSELAVQLARHYYGQAARDGDPRYLGYAQAALTPWWTQAAPPSSVQIMRASLRQYSHDFKGALADLDAVLVREPANAGALSLRATLNFVQARYPAARRDCQALLADPANELLAVSCTAAVDGLTGQVGPAYQVLSETLARHPEADPALRLWALTRLAEMAQRRGRNTQAARHYKQALTLRISDVFLLAAYADFLLDQNRPREVVSLLRDKTQSDTLMLRLTFAERILRLASAPASEADMGARFRAAGLRGDTTHQQEEARFELVVRNDPAKALQLARQNWEVQREPSDARIFLEAAVASKDLKAASPVLEWLDSSGIEDGRLIGLAQQLKGGGK